MPFEDHELAPVEVLRGHVSEETAYLVEDYPYGYRLRCQIRYWLHTADKGGSKGHVRFMSQTTNPKVDGEPWNKPKASTYSPWGVMYKDSLGHVHWWPVWYWGPDTWGHLLFRLRTAYDQLSDQERAGYDELLRRSVTSDGDSWQQAKRAYPLIKEGATRDALLSEHGIHVRDTDYQIAVAALAAGLSI